MEDDKLFTGKLTSYSSELNIEYLLKFYINSYYEIMVRYFVKNSMHLTDDGWLKTTPFLDEEGFNRVYNSRVNEYKIRAQKTKPSDYRFNSFVELLDILKKKGSVYVIVMPVDSQIYQIENSIFPDMTNQIQSVCISKDIPFMDFNAKEFQYEFVDGSHLRYKETSEFSFDLSNWILSESNTQKFSN